MKIDIDICAGASAKYVPVGELICTAMRSRGAVGVVCDGCIRVTDCILEMDFPAFALGSYAQDQRGSGRLVGYRRIPSE